MEFMTKEEFTKYIESIQDTNKFKEIREFTDFDRYKEPTMIDSLSHYLGYFHPRSDSASIAIGGDTSSMFIPDYDYFKTFFESYKSGNFEPVYSNGYLDLRKTLQLTQPPTSKGSGCFTDVRVLLANGDMYIAKFPLIYKSSKSGVTDTSSLYCATIATGVAKAIGVNTSENILGIGRAGERILSKNFLNLGEELITFMEDPKDGSKLRSSEVLSKLEENLTLRNYPKEEIETAKFNFIKQEFCAKLIGLKDQKAENTGLIISTDEKGGRHVRLAPLFDYDYSFHIGEKISLPVMVCDNGKADIASVINQYKDYPGFLDFAKKAVDSLDMNKVYKKIYEETGLEVFETPEPNEKLVKFTNFVDDNLDKARAALKELEIDERGEL